MFAIVEACGRQYQLEAGRFIDCELNSALKKGDAYVFDRVLMIVNGSDSTVGAPFIDGAKVTGRVLDHGRGHKIIVYKQRPKKGTRKKQGHRQAYTRVIIDSITIKDKVVAKAEHTERPSKKEKPASNKKAAEAPKKEKSEKAKSEKKAKPPKQKS
jgi:large subunit ribosomal protein L21